MATKKRQAWTFDGLDIAQLERGSAGGTRRLTREQMDVVFQPILDLASGEVFGLEALARCRQPPLDNPIVLFEHAVRDRAVGYVGRLVRDVAFARAGAVPLFVNLHPGELSSRWLVRPDDPLNFHDAPVYLEITETAAFEYFDLCQSAMREVCARTGARLAIDDFGAGYSNLKRVIDLQPAVVKLDRALITGLDRDRRQQELVRYVVQLCEGLGAQVVAEGIETVDELKALRDAGAHFGQGFLLARPAYPVPEAQWPLTPAGRRRPSWRPKGSRARASDRPRRRRGRSQDDLPALKRNSDRARRPASARPGERRASERPGKGGRGRGR